MSYKVILKVLKGNLDDSEIIFEEQGPCIIGRLPDCALFISAQQDPRISRHHCLLILDPPHARIRDLGSRNGTFVNEEQLTAGELRDDPCAPSEVDRELHPGDIITIGETVFEFQVDPPLEKPPLTASSIPQIQPKRIKLTSKPAKVAEPVTGSIPLDTHTRKSSGGTAIIKPGISVNAYELAEMAKKGELKKLGTETVKDIQRAKKPPIPPPPQNRVKLNVTKLDNSKGTQTSPSGSQPHIPQPAVQKAKLVTPQQKPQIQKAKLVSQPVQPQVQKAKLVAQPSQPNTKEPVIQKAKLVTPQQKPQIQKAKLVSQPVQPQVQKAKLVSQPTQLQPQKAKKVNINENSDLNRSGKEAPQQSDNPSFSQEDSVIYNPLKIQPGQTKKPQRTVKVKIKKLKIK